MEGLTGSRDRKAPRAQTYPEGFLSPDEHKQDFSYRFPTSMVPTAVSYRRSAIHLLPTAVCQLASLPVANTKRHPDLRKSILTVPASSTSRRIPAITCSQRGNGAFSVVLRGLIDSQPFSIVAIPPSLFCQHLFQPITSFQHFFLRLAESPSCFRVISFHWQRIVRGIEGEPSEGVRKAAGKAPSNFSLNLEGG